MVERRANVIPFTVSAIVFPGAGADAAKIKPQ